MYHSRQLRQKEFPTAGYLKRDLINSDRLAKDFEDPEENF